MSSFFVHFSLFIREKNVIRTLHIHIVYQRFLNCSPQTPRSREGSATHVQKDRKNFIFNAFFFSFTYLELKISLMMKIKETENTVKKYSYH